jgi:hypothetical protein
MNDTAIIWTPILTNLSRYLEADERLSAVIAPFMKVTALEHLLELPNDDEIYVITRWLPEEIIRGVSDIGIYPLLKKRGIPLYIHSAIHLKIFLFDSDRAFCSSANITSMGLGLRDPGNLEAGALATLKFDDFLHLKLLRDESRLVTDEIYETYLKCVEGIELDLPKIPEVDLPNISDQKFLLSMLPATESPEKLWDLYSTLGIAPLGNDERHRVVHDLCTYKLPTGLSRNVLDQRLGKGFRDNPFIREIVELIKQKGSIRFGGVNDFIHRTCRDVPLPYRWEIKSTTAHLYNWLAYYYTEITWDRPNYSQVIYWNFEKSKEFTGGK